MIISAGSNLIIIFRYPKYPSKIHKEVCFLWLFFFCWSYKCNKDARFLQQWETGQIINVVKHGYFSLSVKTY